jgi:hypothetical protein
MMRCVEVVTAMEMVSSVYSDSQHGIAARLSPCPKVISGEGSIDPRRLRQTMRQQLFFSPTTIFHFTCQIETHHRIM